MKKSFKRVGVAVLSMAMLLSMGAVGLTANAAGETITVGTGTGLKAGDAVKVYKVASSSAAGWAWETGYDSLGLLTDFKDLTAANVKDVAATLARNTGTVAAKGVVDTPIDVSGSGKGYYLVVAAPSDAGLVAQPMLIEVEDGGTPSITDPKVSQISLTKKITEVSKGGAAKTEHVAENGKNAQAAAGDTVKYRLVAEIPSYDENADKIQNFVLTDKSDNTLTSCAVADFKVFTSPASTASAGTDQSEYLTRTDGQNFKVELPGNTVVKNNGGNFLIVEFTATVGNNATISKGLGVRSKWDDDTNGADANKNDVTVTYGNNYSTGSRYDTNSDGKIDEHDKQPELKDYADVYVTALRINKTFGDSAVQAGADEAGFTLYDKTGKTKIMDEIKTDSDGKVSFTGLDAGEYLIRETHTKEGFVAAADIPVKIESSSPYAVFTAAGWTADAVNGGLTKNVNNPKLGSLPGTGGMGTVLFTVGGASIVLLAGAMFVVYMRKRKNEE